MTTITNAARHFISNKPTQATFLCTDQCNSRCNWCNSWKRPKQKEMTLEEIDSAFKKLKNFGIRMVYLSGGEPLVKKDISDIIDIITKQGMEIIFTTNGLLLNEKNTDKLVKYKNLHINVSLDTLDKDIYKKIRGVDALELVLKNLKLLKKKYPKYPLRATMTVSKMNAKELIRVFKFCKENKIFFSPNPYFSHGEYREENKEFVFEREEMRSLFKEVSKWLSEENYLSGFKVVYNDLDKWFAKENSKLCGAGTSFLWVGPQGQVAACQDLKPFCNILTDDLEKAYKTKIWLPQVSKCCNTNPCYIYCTRSLETIRKNKVKFIKEMLNPKRLIKSFKVY